MSADNEDMRPARGLLAAVAVGLLFYAVGLAIVATWIRWMP